MADNLQVLQSKTRLSNSFLENCAQGPPDSDLHFLVPRCLKHCIQTGRCRNVHLQTDSR